LIISSSRNRFFVVQVELQLVREESLNYSVNSNSVEAVKFFSDNKLEKVKVVTGNFQF